MFTQLINPLDNLTLTCLVALVPVVTLLVMLAVFRLPAWLATLTRLDHHLRARPVGMENAG